jgi:hypothetical protein
MAHTRPIAYENDTTALIGLFGTRIPYSVFLRHLGPRDLWLLAQTCQRLNIIVSDERIWAHLSPMRVAEYLSRRAEAWGARDAVLRYPAVARLDAGTPLVIPRTVFTNQYLPPAVLRAARSIPILRWLCTYGHLDVIRILFEYTRRNNGDARPFRDLSVVRAACRSGNRALVEYLHERVGVTRDEFRADSGALLAACKYRCMEVVAYLFQTVQLTLGDVRDDGCRALLLACTNGDLSMVRYLVETVGLTPQDIRAGGGYFSLRSACLYGHTEVFRYLLPQVNTAADITGMNEAFMLEGACTSGNMELVQMLCGMAGTSTDGDKHQIHVALCKACLCGHAHVVRYLVEYFHLDGMFVSTGNNAALCAAIEKGSQEIMIYLCEEAGLTPADVRANDWSVFQYALRKGRVYAAYYLCRYTQMTVLEAQAVRVAALPRIIPLPSALIALKFLVRHLNLKSRELCPRGLTLAAAHGRLDVIQYILDTIREYLPPGGTEILKRGVARIACENGKLHIIKYMFEEGGLTAEDLHVDNDQLLLAAMASPDPGIVAYVNTYIAR